MIVLSLLLAAATPTADDARVLTSIVASALAEDPRVDVVTQQDLRKAVALEAERQTLGCSAESCLAEVAAAMGARLVVFGSVGTFDDELVLELSTFDADTATSLGRTVLSGPTLKALSQEAAARTKAQRDAAMARIGGDAGVRVLVLDFELRNAAAPAPAPATTVEAGLSGLQLAGIGAALAAGTALVVGIAADNIAVSEQTAADAVDGSGQLIATAAEAEAHYETASYGKTFAIVGYVAAGVLTATAVGLLVVGSGE